MSDYQFAYPPCKYCGVAMFSPSYMFSWFVVCSNESCVRDNRYTPHTIAIPYEAAWYDEDGGSDE